LTALQRARGHGERIAGRRTERPDRARRRHGFGVSNAFGGPVSTPTLDALPRQGLRYKNFHTTELCLRTRAALKAGRNQHTVNMWAPYLYDGVAPAGLPDDPNYHSMTDMTDKAVAWIKYQNALTPAKPVFIYFAPGATHAPHHVPKQWIARWKGKLDQGWDQLREETLARQTGAGIVPKGTKPAPKPAAIKDWKHLSADEKRLFSHQAEVFAAYAEYTDHEIGRVMQAFEDIGETDNTLVFFIAGDNGTSGEGGMNGMFDEYTYSNGVHEQVADMLKQVDQWGGPATYPHMAAGWAVRFDASFGWMKQVPSDFGGTRNGMVVRWPKG